jgi:hypothetical protein
MTMEEDRLEQEFSRPTPISSTLRGKIMHYTTMMLIGFIFLSMVCSMSGTALADPIADFSFEQTGLEVKFTDESTPQINIIQWYWDFSDGTQSSVQNPIHTFPGFGNYTVYFTVWTSDGTSNIKTEVVWVNPANQEVQYTGEYLIALCLICCGAMIVIFGRFPSIQIGGAIVTFIGVMAFISQPMRGLNINTDSQLISYGIPLIALVLVIIGISLSRNPSVRISLAMMLLISIVTVALVV